MTVDRWTCPTGAGSSAARSTPASAPSCASRERWKRPRRRCLQESASTPATPTPITAQPNPATSPPPVPPTDAIPPHPRHRSSGLHRQSRSLSDRPSSTSPTASFLSALLPTRRHPLPPSLLWTSSPFCSPPPRHLSHPSSLQPPSPRCARLASGFNLKCFRPPAHPRSVLSSCVRVVGSAEGQKSLQGGRSGGGRAIHAVVHGLDYPRSTSRTPRTWQSACRSCQRVELSPPPSHQRTEGRTPRPGS